MKETPSFGTSEELPPAAIENEAAVPVEDKDPVSPEARAEDWHARRERVGSSIVEQYSKEGDERTLDHVLRGYGTEQQIEEQLGISKDKAGRVRIKSPFAEGIPGKYENPDVLKALIVGFNEAHDDEERWQVVEHMCDYLGIDAPARPSAEELEEAGGLPSWLKRKGSAFFATASLLFVMLAMPEVPPTSAEQGVAAGVSGKVPSVERGAAGDRALGSGETLTDVARGLLEDEGIPATEQNVATITKILAEDNGVRSPGYGVTKGALDEHELPTGFSVSTTRAKARAGLL